MNDTQHRISTVELTTPVQYRKATSQDAQTLADYRVRFLKELFGDQPQHIINELSRGLAEYYRAVVEEGSYIAYLATSGETQVGVGGMVIRNQAGSFRNLSGRCGYMMNMYTVPAFRGHGVCSAILQLLTEDARALNITVLELLATKAGEPVYRKIGFEKHTEPVYRKYI